MNTKDKREDVFVKAEQNAKNWYVLYVKSRKEKVANDALMEAGFKTYLPLKKELRTWSQRKKWVEEPIFKSYVFVKIRKNELYDVTKVDQVVTYVRFAGEPAIVREKHLLLVKKMLINETSFEVQQGTIVVGKEISIKTGPFKGFSGIIKEIRGRKKFVVQLSSMGTKLVISFNDIIPPKELTSEDL